MTGDTTIKRAHRGDAEALAALHASCFKAPWDAASFEALLKNTNTFALMASRGPSSGHLKAFIVTCVASDEAEILSLGTVPSARRSGLARALVRAASTMANDLGANKMFLEVAADNAVADALYSGIGFLPAGSRPGYYGGGEQAIDALILRARLPLVN